MAGVLDSKTRVLDSVITQEGKRQIAGGGLRAVFATVSDSHTYYQKSGSNVAEDATKRVYFEAPVENINDSITMESDDSGKLLGYPVQSSEFFSSDGVVSGRTSVSGTLVYATPENFTGFASLAEGIITSSIDRFKNLYSIGTRDGGESDSLQMKLSTNHHTFTLNNMFPFVDGPTDATTDVDYVEPLFFDERLANVSNFTYLPPVTEKLTKEETLSLSEGDSSSENFPSSKLFGNYVKLQRPTKLSLQDIMNQLNVSTEYSGSDSDHEDENQQATQSSSSPWRNDYARGGSSISLFGEDYPRERIPIYFKSTSDTNNLMMQMFELDPSASKLKKLDVIDYGTVFSENDLKRPEKRVFFVGKIFINSISLPVFVNMFVIIMD